jgi:hypothetical protein
LEITVTWLFIKAVTAFLNSHVTAIAKYNNKYSLICLDSKALFKEAKRRLAPLIQQNDLWSYFCLSRLYAASHKPEKCHAALQMCKHKRYLQKATKWQLQYFENVKHLPWFQQLAAENSEESSSV